MLKKLSNDSVKAMLLHLYNHFHPETYQRKCHLKLYFEFPDDTFCFDTLLGK